ncbi:hypothetical protein [Candidatus Poriferisocius sp.]|uniref:hypothetical protein n=1 Tax=Candidatus Poriferisocius sp. TaxID=3101276 RepID=UPI003B025580
MSLHERLEKIRSLPVPQNEESAKFQILAPVLQDLGWDPYGPEVLFEHPVGGKGSGRVDIALKRSGRIYAMIEAKAPNSNLSNHVTQVLGYAFHEGVDICVLTTGLEWWLYLPRESGDPAKRRFSVLHLMNDPIDRLSDDLEVFLSKEALVSGQAVQRAKLVLKASLETARLNKEIPGIWEQMLSKPDDELVELVSKRVYENTNLRPANDQVIEALQRSPQPSILKSNPKTTVPLAPIVADTRTSSRRSERKQSPTSFELWGQSHQIRMWKEITCKVAELLYDRHPHEFHKMLELRGRMHPYVAQDPQELKVAKPNSYHQIGSTGYYIDIHLSADHCVKRAQLFLDCFGYSSSELKINFD